MARRKLNQKKKKKDLRSLGKYSWKKIKNIGIMLHY